MRVDAATNWGATPLHLAAFHGHLQTIKFLPAAGADLDAQDKRGLTPRILADGRGNKRCAELLHGEGDAAAESIDSTQTETTSAVV